jgi:hypothetical protein
MLMSIFAVAIAVGVLSDRAEAQESNQPRKMAERVKASVPGYFDMIESAGCGQ